MKQIQGGVTAAKGFKAGGIHVGVKKTSSPDKKDLAMILSDCECTAAGMYTLNRVKASPVYITMEHLENGVAQGVIVNSGNANACAPHGHENARRMCQAAAQATGLKAEDFAVASTGVIGQTTNIAVIEEGVPSLVENLSYDGSDAAAAAIMTTDTKKKEIALSVEIGGKEVKIGAIAKGSGMIHPNMGTMLCFITTDCAITHEMLQDALHEAVPRTFNRVTVDGDTSTNDMCVVLANGMAGNELIEWKDDNFHAFQDALHAVCGRLDVAQLDALSQVLDLVVLARDVHQVAVLVIARKVACAVHRLEPARVRGVLHERLRCAVVSTEVPHHEARPAYADLTGSPGTAHLAVVLVEEEDTLVGEGLASGNDLVVRIGAPNDVVGAVAGDL